MTLCWLVLAACDSEDTGDTAGPDSADTADSGDGTVTDPLSMPATPTLDAGDFPTSDTCAECHPDHVAEWAVSTHAYAIVDPVFQALVGLRQGHADGREDRVCTQCHSAIGVRSGEIGPGFSFSALSPVVQEGVTCVACHTVTDVQRPYNSGHVLDPGAPMQGPIADAASTTAHLSAYSDLFDDAELCGGCHDVTEPTGLELERPYAEWLQSPSQADGTPCQGCHMTSTRGPAATGGPERDRHDHRFVGLDNPTGDPELQARVEALLTDIAAVDLIVPASSPVGERLVVTADVHNLIDGHNLPTGSTFIRELWVELLVADDAGTIVYASGTLGVEGDLRGYWSPSDPYGDPDLVTFGSAFVDAWGEPTLFPWLASEHWSAAIPPQYHRAVSWMVPTDTLAEGTYTVSARLRLRPFPPFLLRALGQNAAADAQPIYDLASADAVVELR